MADPFRKYDGLAYREIEWRLRRQDMPEEMIRATLDAVREHRRARANAKLQRRERDKQWGEVISSLQHERKILRSMSRYKTREPAPERDDFVANYLAALDTLYAKLQAKRSLDDGLPEHSHWTDYVPQRIKQVFIDEAASIPPRQKAKFKDPFRKADPTKLRDLRHGRLLRQIRSCLDTVLAKLDVDPDNEAANHRERLLRVAYDRTKALPDDAHVPSHWADMVQDLIEAHKAKVKAQADKARTQAE